MVLAMLLFTERISKGKGNHGSRRQQTLDLGQIQVQAVNR